jgi:transposase
MDETQRQLDATPAEDVKERLRLKKCFTTCRSRYLKRKRELDL